MIGKLVLTTSAIIAAAVVVTKVSSVVTDIALQQAMAAYYKQSIKNK